MHLRFLRRYTVLALAVPLLLATAAESSGENTGMRLVEAARGQVGVTVHYDPAYVGLAYPGGDIAPERGVCTDVVIRALRALGHDLQVQVHEDMRRNFDRYPNHWGLTRPDRNIDHRRVPNLEVFFDRMGMGQEVRSDAEAFLPGDIVTWRLKWTNRPHIGIVSDRKSRRGVPLILHNIGRGTREEDMLFDHRITGHYRWPSVIPE